MNRPRTVFLVGVVLLYGALLVASQGLRHPAAKDELHFWPTSMEFAQTLVPSLEQLRGYNELNTPLPFVVFGFMEHVFGGGIALGRSLNLALSLAVVLSIGWPRHDKDWERPICALGLVSFPYFVGASVYLYTDMMAAFWAVIGVAFYRGRRHWLAALCFALGIACRQYMVAFPIAVAVWEGWGALLALPRLRASWIAPSVAAATLGLWILFFGGFAPPVAVETQHLSTVRLLRLFPDRLLYFCAVVGFYYVAIEFLLLRRWRDTGLTDWMNLRSTALGAAVVVGFVLFPPLRNVDYSIPTMGFLDKALQFLPDVARVVVFTGLALLAVARFHRPSLETVLVVVNAGVMLKSHIAWDKYALALLVVLWWLRASGSGGTPVRG